MTEPIVQSIEGRRTIVIDSKSNLPRSMPDLLRAMDGFGFTFRDDFDLKGTRPACESLRVHRFRRFREGRWWNPSAFPVVIGKDGDTLRTVTVPHGVTLLSLQMCEDCGAVVVRDVSPHAPLGAKPARLINTVTGETRVAPAVGNRDLVIGWYSGARRNGREYR